MARTSGTVIENNFVKGFITESTALSFPPNAATSTENCIFVETGLVTRRPEIDIESDGVYSNTSTTIVNQAHTEYLWRNAGGTGLVNLSVVQEGALLHFYDVSTSTTVSLNKLASTVDLTAFKAAGSPYEVALYPCQYASGNSDLIVVNKSCDPIYLAYNPDTRVITATKITLKYRDFKGAQTGYANNFRPAFSSISAMKTDPVGALHFYNLLNQGWWQGLVTIGSPDPTSALGQWDAARTDMPSSQDAVSYYRSSSTDAFDPALVDSVSRGNTLTPKGHFILEYGKADRQAALTAEAYTLTYSSTSASAIASGTGTGIVSAGVNPASHAFDGDVNTNNFKQVLNVSAAGLQTLDYFVGKDFSASPKKMNKVIIKPIPNSSSNTFGLAYSGSITVTYYPVTFTFELRGHSSAPTTGQEGTLLASTSFTSTNVGTPQTLTSTDTTTAFNYVWVYVKGTFTSPSTTPHNFFIATSETELYETVTTVDTGNIPASDITYERPSTCAFYAGRAWYAGFDYRDSSTSIFFSQLVDRPENYGMCYQNNDPTSEEFFNLLPTDGGVIRIPEIGKIIRLWVQQSTLILFSTNGIWTLSGPGQGQSFSATDFTIRKLSSQGTQSPFSFVDVKGFPMWWGEDGIFILDYNPQFDAFSVKSVSQETIQSYFASIPAGRRAYVKGAYDSSKDVVHWLTTTKDTNLPMFEYDTVLCFNTRSKAFYPWVISDSTPKVVGCHYVVDSIGFSPSAVKFTTVIPVTPTTERITFSDTNHAVNTYQDWNSFSTGPYGVVGDAKPYVSYFISGYRIDGETQRFFQDNYIFVFLNHEANAGAYLQSVWNFSVSTLTNDWGVRQQLFNTNLHDVSVNFSRLKLRGKGRALQIKISSDGNKPFGIIGWSSWETINSKN